MSLSKSEPIARKGVLGLWLGNPLFGWPVIVPTRTEVLKPLLSTKERIDKSFIYRMFLDLLGCGLISSKRDVWNVHRKLLNPTFHSKLLTGFTPIIRNQAAKLVSKLDTISKNGDETINNLSDIISGTTMAIICETAMGIQEDEIDSKYSASLSMVDRLMVSRFESAYKAIDWIYALTPDGREFYNRIRFVKNVGLQLVKTRIKNFQKPGDESIKVSSIKSDLDEDSSTKESGMRQRSLVDTLILAHLENPKEMTEEMIRDEVDTFLAAGHDTTTWGLTWTLIHLGQHADIQEKLLEEISEVFGNEIWSESDLKRTIGKEEEESSRNLGGEKPGNIGGEKPGNISGEKSGNIERDLSDLITIENVSRMKYLECVILESLRLNPIVPFFGREILTDMSYNVDGTEYIIPKGSSVLVVPDIIHRNPRYWCDPERFKPDRFLSERSRNRDPLSFLAFSFGPRNCIGRNFAMIEMKVILIHLLLRFKITCLDHIDTVQTDYAIARRCLHPVKFKFQVR